MVKNRTGLSKKRRFAVFARDDFTCRYCGENSGSVKLHVDHIIPVSAGGTNDESNLITSCQPCNAGKGATRLEKVAPTEQDALRIAQENREQIDYAKLAKKALKSRNALRDCITEYYDTSFRSGSLNDRCVTTLCNFVREFESADRVFRWMDMANSRDLTSDHAVRYICGIAKNFRNGEGG